MSNLSTRQAQLLTRLQQSDGPLPGQALADQLGVTRQVVVHDIALLRASGYRVLATPKGYLLQETSLSEQTLLAVSHPPEKTAEELNILVDCGLKVVDVRVEHQIYGEMVGSLYLSSRRDVEHFLNKLCEQNAPLLSTLTDGDHYHLVEYDTDDQLADAIGRLKNAGIQVFA